MSSAREAVTAGLITGPARRDEGGSVVQIVFLNRLERLEGKEEFRGQVFIGEHQGTWTAGWRSGESGPAAEDEVWYEGVSWEELLAAFRHGAAVKMKEGFRPLIDGMLETPVWEREPSQQLLVQCYAELQQENPELTAALRQWRRARASEEKRSAYLVATNRELHMLAVYVPRTPAELAQIPGFGKLKTERYGSDLIGLLQGVPREHAFPLDWVAQAVDADQFAQWMFRVKEEKYGRALSSVRDKRSLLSAIREGKTLAEMESELQCERRKLVERIEKLDEEGYDVLPVVDLELSAVPTEEWTQASEAMVQLGDRYLKPLLRKVYGEGEAAQQEVERQYEKLRMMRIRFRRERQTAI
ncbi:HRDC domain-containing protein [Cohnella sp. CFH 77786]|uniref:HRDC domain-containing protein n=1 Tax=Cohnella sp. CFH 77786 TaxID=2662265 RepID=UPI001C60F2D2|nr:HRDC domain-containing protein [Cohnella sp. CFH 77786]